MRWPWTARREARLEERRRREAIWNRRLDEAHAELLSDVLDSLAPGEELTLNVDNTRYVARLAVLAGRSLNEELEPLAREAAEATRALERGGVWNLGDPAATLSPPEPTPQEQQILDRLAEVKDSLGQAGGWQLQLLVSKRARNIGYHHGINGTLFAPNFFDAGRLRRPGIDDSEIDAATVRRWQTDILSPNAHPTVDVADLPPYASLTKDGNEQPDG